MSAYLPMMTSEDLMMALTLSPTLRLRSSAASFVIEDVMWMPFPTSTFNVVVTAPMNVLQLSGDDIAGTEFHGSSSHASDMGEHASFCRGEL